MKNNLYLALLTSLLFIISEAIFRLSNEFLLFKVSFKDTVSIFLVFFLLTFIKSNKVYKSISLFLIIITFAQMANFSYFGAWLSPISIYLFFTHMAETFQTLNQELYILVLPLILSIFLFVSIFIHSYFAKKLVKNSIVSYVLIVLLLIEPARIFLMSNQDNAKIQKSDFIIKTTWKSLSNFIGYILPVKAFNINSQPLEPVKIASKLDIDPEAKTVNVIFILGESLRKHNMSLYGYPLNTTPYLKELSLTSKSFLHKVGIASSVFTDVSIPSLINCLDKQNQVETILSQNTCLFNLAKQNNFKTHFISSQSHDALNSITSNICINKIDYFVEAYSTTNDIYAELQDEFLLSSFKNINLEESNFIVLQQSGSHSPYNNKYPSEFNKFTEKTKINEYDNSILYSDYVFKKLFSYIKEKTKQETIVIFTSDHGESLGENGILGHGNYEENYQYEVPFFLYSINKPLDNVIVNGIKKLKVISHYQVSKLISHYLGYEINNEDIFLDKNITVIGKDIKGLDGFKLLNIRDMNK